MNYYMLYAYGTFLLALAVILGMGLYWVSTYLDDPELDTPPSGRHRADPAGVRS